MNMRLMLAGAAMMLVVMGADAKNDEREKVEILYETTLNLIHLLVEQGVIKQEVADEMIRKAEQKARLTRQQAEGQSGATGVVAGAPEIAEAGDEAVPPKK